MKLIAANSNPALAESISEHLDVPLVDADINQFSDGETGIEIRENMRGEDVFVIQSTSRPANHHLMELMICIDALRRSSAHRITAVIPYFGYARQDSKSAPRTPITAKLVADLLTEAGANRILTLDLHARQTQGFFNIPCDNLFANPLFAKEIRGRFEKEKLTIVSPDVGGVVRARAGAKSLGSDLAIVDKRREKANESEVMSIIGDVKGRNCIFIDDMVDTAGTLCNGAAALLEEGAESVHAYCSHGVLSGEANKRLDETDALSSVTITDSIRYPHEGKGSKKVRKISVAPLLSKAINRIHQESSISALFEQ